jgi:hypothetical protein
VAHWSLALRSDTAATRVISAPDRPRELVAGEDPAP